MDYITHGEYMAILPGTAAATEAQGNEYWEGSSSDVEAFCSLICLNKDDISFRLQFQQIMLES